MSAVGSYICSRQDCYGAGKDVLGAMAEARIATDRTKLEQAFAMCKSEEKIYGKTKLDVEDKCTGDKCSVRSAKCGVTKPQVANFHTHPYARPQTFNETSPSYGDLVSATNNEWAGRSEGVTCIASNQKSDAECWRIRKRVTNEELRKLYNVYDRRKHDIGKDAWNDVIGNYQDWWGIGPAEKFDLTKSEYAVPPPPVVAPPPPPRPKEFGKKEYRERVGKIRYYGTLAKETDERKALLLKPYTKEAKEASKNLRIGKKRIQQRIAAVEGAVYGRMPDNEKRRLNDLKLQSADLRHVKRVNLKQIIDSCRNSRSERCIT